MKTVEMQDARQLSETVIKNILNIGVCGEKSAFAQGVLDEMEKDNYFPYMVFKKRMEVFKLPLNLTPGAIFFIMCVSDRPGHVTCAMVDCMQYQEDNKKTEVTLNDLMMKMYPFGFYNEEGFGRRIDEIKEQKNKWDSIY